MKNILTLLLSVFVISLSAQTKSVTGKLLDPSNEPVIYANMVLYKGTEMVKVATTDIDGLFSFNNIASGSYKLVGSYVGMDDFVMESVTVTEGQTTDLGELSMTMSGIELETATVTARRALVEIKPDRTVFNVQGTINSTGDNGLGLLRKAPGVVIDNNDNITVLGRTGVLVYVDGKRLPLAGDELKIYLQNLQADQIDKFDIITNPGARYEAEGNAGIIDIRLKRNENHGSNGSISGTVSQGRRFKANASSTGNYRNNNLNTFGSLGWNDGESLHFMKFKNYQNGLLLDEITDNVNHTKGISYRWGTDFFVGKNHTIGFLISGGNSDTDRRGMYSSTIAALSSPEVVDSMLISNSSGNGENDQATYNVNYLYRKDKSTLNIDLDFGQFKNGSMAHQPNQYYNAAGTTILSEAGNNINTNTNIDIYTGKVDYETDLGSGKLGLGSKLSQVKTDNKFYFYDINNGNPVLSDNRSNDFDYDERVLAGYVNYSAALNRKVSYSAGLRAEHTDATGVLSAVDQSRSEDPVEFNYISYFPSAGVTYTPSRMYTWSLNYGRRINRPDYNVLNPFESQLSELSFSKGNPFLRPEIVNNLELGLTYKYMYNFKLAYSKTTDQITRLIGPDDRDPRAGFITWDNLASQTITSLNISAPFQVNDWWSLFANASLTYQDNQADYGENGKVDLQAASYSLFQQSTFKLGKGYVAEISGWYSGPGIWGGVFKFDPSYSLNVGLQKKFFGDKMNVKLSAQDITYQSGWTGVSNFNGLQGEGQGNYDSRFVSLSMSYLFGNNKVKSRKRSTGMEDESKRVKDE